KFDAKFTSADQLRNMTISSQPDGSKVFLKDVADVVDGQSEVSAINHINGLPSIGVKVLKQTDANAVDVSKLVKESLDKLEKDYAGMDLKFEIASDQSIYTLQSADAVMHDLMIA